MFSAAYYLILKHFYYCLIHIIGMFFFPAWARNTIITPTSTCIASVNNQILCQLEKNKAALTVFRVVMYTDSIKFAVL